MERIMLRRALLSALVTGLTAVLSACGGGGSASSGNSNPPPPQTANMQLLVSDATSDDWATIGVQLQSVALVPSDGSANVTIWTAATATPLELVELDNLADIIGSVSVPVNTYSGAIITVAGNPGDVMLTVAWNPE